MRSVMTFVKTGRIIPETDRTFWRLSAYLARRFYPPLKLYADKESAEKFVKEWGIVFDEIDTDTIAREARTAHPMCWSAGKLAAFKSMAAEGKPFFHIDGDAFIFKRLGAELESSPMFAQCVETSIKLATALYRRNSNYPLRELLQDLNMPMWMMKYARRPRQNVVNMGIFGGNDCRSIYEYAETALKTFVRDRTNNAQFKRFYQAKKGWLGIAALSEQWTLAAYCWHRRIELDVVMYRTDAFNLNRSHELPGHYCHIYTFCRKLPSFQHWVEHKWKEIINKPELLAA